ncbi:MAG: Asp-tRNA(Asn)/Glu-tRNA(Gln) amidotransferase subunit GatC [Acidimicrobiia bacterium]|nr:Asp-tRNA(Asn)/Glu-tRNA(Gln) amidotransferase subunit GatC [Acidimicrobiia bacterium]
MSQDSAHDLTRDDVAKVAKLALLELDEAQLDTFTGQLAAVLDRARELAAFDIDDVPPTAHPYPLVNVFRPDVVEDLEDVREEALAAAPDVEDHLYKVPPALGEEP